MQSSLTFLLASSTIVAYTGFVSAATSKQTSLVSDNFIKEINSKAETWVAGRNFHPGTPLSYFKALVPKHNIQKKISFPSCPNNTNPFNTSTALGSLGGELPSSFDPREKWPTCKSISMIWNQGNCGTCWIFAATTAMSDRLCIHSGGKLQTLVSPENVRNCLFHDIGIDYGDCTGGDAISAWCMWYQDGIVSGGPFGSQEGCQPYKIQPCEHHHANGTLRPCPSYRTKKNDHGRDECHLYCENKSYKTKYSRDRTFGTEPYFTTSEKDIMVELMTNGPVSAQMMVYEDFLSYKSGVYKHVKGKLLSGHYIRVLGWGEENGTPYWLVANTWGSDWGDHGLFKVTRDEYDDGSLGEFTAGLPKLGNYKN